MEGPVAPWLASHTQEHATYRNFTFYSNKRKWVSFVLRFSVAERGVTPRHLKTTPGKM
jgi:hypothetical protein